MATIPESVLSFTAALLLMWFAVGSQAQLSSSTPTTASPSLPQQPQQQPQPPQQQLQPPQLQPQPQPQLLLPTPYSPQNSVLLQCRQTVPSTDLDVVELQRQVLPVSQSGQCLLACAAQRLGFMQPNYPLQPQGAAALMGALFPSRAFDPVFQNSLMLTVNQCLSQSPTLSQLTAAPTLGFNLFNSAARELNQFNPVNYVPLIGR
ncbi:hypothetical protein FOCC_FOCC001982 [Frankliniella occidentalis]|uniref:Uncharacterized protein LOC113216959 n=1 Tax=Frankliniella occidentalis TaxID=133901 RepID=A0A6J1TGH0_FRAOC|nr:uncharacterized protein LOC113216959 [Frankliniella occidentalis]KAE8751408.1 hypothetical protein FOCC_FOCC001982 [Frankliniella occidentalis]